MLDLKLFYREKNSVATKMKSKEERIDAKLHIFWSKFQK